MTYHLCARHVTTCLHRGVSMSFSLAWSHFQKPRHSTVFLIFWTFFGVINVMSIFDSRGISDIVRLVWIVCSISSCCTFPKQMGLKTPHISEFPNKATTNLFVCVHLWWRDTMFCHGWTGQRPIMGHPGHIAQPPKTPNHIGLTGLKCYIAPEIAVCFAQFPHFLICEGLGQKDWPNGGDTPIYKIKIHHIHAIISIMIGHDEMKRVWSANRPLEHNKLHIILIWHQRI